jgi:hypothetical protein
VRYFRIGAAGVCLDLDFVPALRVAWNGFGVKVFGGYHGREHSGIIVSIMGG